MPRQTETDCTVQETREIVEMINEMAEDLMFSAYDRLPFRAKVKLSNLTKKTHKILHEP